MEKDVPIRARSLSISFLCIFSYTNFKYTMTFSILMHSFIFIVCSHATIFCSYCILLVKMHCCLFVHSFVFIYSFITRDHICVCNYCYGENLPGNTCFHEKHSQQHVSDSRVQSLLQSIHLKITAEDVIYSD